MASLVTCLVTNLSFCFCTAFTSLLGSCCGNDKPSTTAPGPTSGRKRSVFVLFISICLSLAYQYGLAPFFVENVTLEMATTYFEDTWLDGCEEYVDNIDLQKRCAGNNGNFRVAGATTIFFILAGIAAKCKPTANREAWPAKILLYLFLVAATAFIPNDPLFSDVYLNIARVGGILFIVVQQIIILDVAYNWNDSWVEKSNQAESDEGPGAGQKWLGAILASCLLLFGAALIGIVLLFIYFTGCTANNAFISTTLILCIVLTLAQLSGEEASLLSSACISAWAVFLCYSAVSKNPNETCNPRIGDSDTINIVIGLTLTLMSLCWAGWSWTAEDKLSSKNENADDDANGKHEDAKKVEPAVTGVAVETQDDEDNNDNAEVNTEQSQPSNSSGFKLNIALAAVSCWTAMVLTDWGAIQADGEIKNMSTGRTAMWMIMASQWVVLTLYVWTLVAPRLFPDREFS